MFKAGVLVKNNKQKPEMHLSFWRGSWKQSIVCSDKTSQLSEGSKLNHSDIIRKLQYLSIILKFFLFFFLVLFKYCCQEILESTFSYLWRLNLFQINLYYLNDSLFFNNYVSQIFFSLMCLEVLVVLLSGVYFPILHSSV